jgi:hypothetical protein
MSSESRVTNMPASCRVSLLCMRFEMNNLENGHLRLVTLYKHVPCTMVNTTLLPTMSMQPEPMTLSCRCHTMPCHADPHIYRPRQRQYVPTRIKADVK